MKKTSLFNKKAIVVVPIVLALILGSVGTIGLVGGFNKRNINEPQAEYMSIEELKKSIDDETVLKIIDIYENLDDYLDTTHTFEVQFYEFEDGYSVGIEYFFQGDDSLLFDIPADFSKIEIPENIQVTDWIKVTGKIGKTEEADNDHSHTFPIIYINSVSLLE